MALQEIDGMRKDGKFIDSEGNRPEGQLVRPPSLCSHSSGEFSSQIFGHQVLLYLLRRCYGLCYRLMASSEPISEELMPIANKLTTIKRCLSKLLSSFGPARTLPSDILLLSSVEVQKYGGPYSGRDLYPYQLALAQIDDLRTDGRFQGRDGSIPEGQAILNAYVSQSVLFEAKVEPNARL